MMNNRLAVAALDQSKRSAILDKIANKTKPPGALGQLEDLALQLALIQGQASGDWRSIQLNQPCILVFAGDHGIASEGVSIAPSVVTQQMVHNFLGGGAAINCFCRLNQIELKVVDAGILLPIDDPRLVQQSLGLGTHNFSQQAAMTLEQVETGLRRGGQVAIDQIEAGCNLLGFGEMGIANTSSAAAIMAATLKLSAETCVGRGTGISDQALARKIALVDQALRLHAAELETPRQILASVGGFEIVQMVGAMLAGASKGCTLLVDGFIATAAALVARQIERHVTDYMVFCHQSNEQAHGLMLEKMHAKPLLNLGLRLGEGTGAALAVPLLRAAESFYNQMASFDSAGVNPV